MPRHVQVRFDETFAGNGSLDYQAYFTELAKLDADVPLMIEHVNARQTALGHRLPVRAGRPRRRPHPPRRPPDYLTGSSEVVTNASSTRRD